MSQKSVDLGIASLDGTLAIVLAQVVEGESKVPAKDHMPAWFGVRGRDVVAILQFGRLAIRGGRRVEQGEWKGTFVDSRWKRW